MLLRRLSFEELKRINLNDWICIFESIIIHNDRFNLEDAAKTGKITKIITKDLELLGLTAIMNNVPRRTTIKQAGLAQSDRVAGFEPVGWGFESLRRRHCKRGDPNAFRCWGFYFYMEKHQIGVQIRGI